MRGRRPTEVGPVLDLGRHELRPKLTAGGTARGRRSGVSLLRDCGGGRLGTVEGWEGKEGRKAQGRRRRAAGKSEQGAKNRGKAGRPTRAPQPRANVLEAVHGREGRLVVFQ
eukprot:8585289-Pyramimonas_sp.AAC.1